jgi:hypothetical protein
MAKWTEEQKLAAKEAYALKMENAAKERTETKENEEYKNSMNYLHKVEEFNGEEIPESQETSLGFRMNREEKLQSVINTLRVLPPSMAVDGRHRKENVQALNCFQVTQEMLDEIYSTHEHDAYGQLIRKG